MPPRLRLCRALAGAVTALVSLATVAACGAGVPRPAPGPAQVLSNYERNGTTIRRDCGYSSPLPGKPGWSLWLFCDTVIASVRSGQDDRLILGTDTAAAGPYPASWISGVAREPAADTPAHLLISYDNYCVSGNAGALAAEEFGLIEYDPAGNLLGSPAVVFGSFPGFPLPPQQVLGSPLFGGDGYLYLFGFCPARPPPAGCGGGRVFLARTAAQAAYWQNPLTYQYWTGIGWSPGAAAAGTLLPAHPFGISVGDYTADGHGLVMVEQTSLAAEIGRASCRERV